MNKGILGVIVAAAFVTGMLVNATPVYGPIPNPQIDDRAYKEILKTTQKKLQSLNNFFHPPPDDNAPPPDDNADIDRILENIQTEIVHTQDTLEEWQGFMEGAR